MKICCVTGNVGIIPYFIRFCNFVDTTRRCNLTCIMCVPVYKHFFFWSGKPEGERREAGVGFAIKKDIITKLTEMPRPVSDRIMMMRLPLSKDNFATIISVYVPTMTIPNENKEAFYNQLASVFSGIPRTDKLLLMRQCQVALGYGQTWDWEM